MCNLNLYQYSNGTFTDVKEGGFYRLTTCMDASGAHCSSIGQSVASEMIRMNEEGPGAGFSIIRGRRGCGVKT